MPSSGLLATVAWILAAIAVSVGMLSLVILYLQWYLGSDDFREVGVLAVSTAVAGFGFLIYRRSRERGAFLRALALSTAFGAVAVAVVAFRPDLVRTLGPWCDLSRVLVAESAHVRTLLAAEGRDGQFLPFDRAQLLNHGSLGGGTSYAFPLIRKRVLVRITYGLPPYVGVDYGGGRVCTFSLDSMKTIACD